MSNSPSVTDAAALPRARDAEQTRRALLEAALRRFAIDGYRSTTVRDIAADAGVNVALINRYFASKEGLFEACLTRTAEEFAPPAGDTVERIVQGVVEELATAGPDEKPLLLLLLVRSSGEERADGIRQRSLRTLAERIAERIRPEVDRIEADAILLRAQVVVATAIGTALLRSSSGLEPLGSATPKQLTSPLEDAFLALLR